MITTYFKGISLTIIIFAFCLNSGGTYEIPTPTLQLLTPKGLRISIPDEPGIQFFAFHGSINHEIRGVQPGDFYGEATEPTRGRWIYENTKINVEPGDILYYWIHVQYEKSVYRLLEKSVTIPPARTDGTRTTTTTERVQYDGSSSLEGGGDGGGDESRPNNANTSPSSRPSQFPSESNDRFNTGAGGGGGGGSSGGSGDNSKNCILSKTTVRGRSVCAGELIFQDNFDILNWTQWKREIRIPLDSVDGDFVSFQNRPENCYITDGRLHIVPNLLTEVPRYNEEAIRTGFLDLGPECTGIINNDKECKRQAGLFRILPPIVSARIRTKDFFSFRYGKVEVRARLTRGDWLFPQIFLEPLANEYGISGYSSGQMRVAFIRGNEILDSKEGNQIDGYRLSGGVVLTVGDTFRDVWLKSSLRREHLGRNFHVYSLTWTDDSVTLSVDGNDYATIRGGFGRLSRTHNITYATQWENGGFMAPFDKEFYIALGVSAGGVSDFPDGCRNGAGGQLKPWGNVSPKAELKFWNDREIWHRTWEGEDAGMEVDYIKVWAL